MIDWISANRWRMPVIFVAYFALHITARSFVSSSLDYDESEQLFLSQSLSLGYNSQPPLYTWVQTAIFELLGYSVLSLAVFKNLLLCATYLLVFGLVRKATDSISLAAVAATGLLMIPQISWESHRDLSHTVAVTLATTLMFYSVVSLAGDGRSRWYVLIGLAAALGILSKYNFAIVIVGMIAAGLSIPTYRKYLIDRRMIVAVVAAAILILPHAVWMATHLDLISSKTISTMTTNQSSNWFHNVKAGFTALVASILGCCAIVLAIYLPYFRGRKEFHSSIDPAANHDHAQATMLLLERFLIAVTIVLCLLVLSGNALEFKNRWLQPFIVMVPAYLVLRFRKFVSTDRVAMNLGSAVALLLMVAILTAVVTRPLLGSYRKKFCWLNVPYAELASTIDAEFGNAALIVVVSDMRMAGNLRLHLPRARVLSRDQPNLSDRIIGSFDEDLQATKIVMVTATTSESSRNRLIDFARAALSLPAEPTSDWRSVNIRYLFGGDADAQSFAYQELTVERIASASEQRR